MSKSQAVIDYLKTVARQAKQGASLGTADEIQDVVGSVGAKYVGLPLARLFGGNVTDESLAEILSQARKRSRDELSADWQDRPVTSIASNIAGFLPFALGQAGVRATMGTTKAAPAAITKAADAIAKFNTGLQTWAGAGSRAARAAKSAAIGAGYGAASGFGAADDTIASRAQGLGLGAAIGAATGGAAGAASRSAPTRQSVAPKVAKTVAENKAEQEFLRQLLLRPDLQNMQVRANMMQALSKKTGIDLTLPEMLAQTDVDPLLAQQAILAKSPETAGAAQSILQRRMGDPLAGQPGQLVSALQNQARQLSPGSYDDLAQQLIREGKTAASNITKQLKEQAGPLYAEAMKANKSIASPELDKILETPAGKQALAQARTILQNEGTQLGIPDKELGELARELGIRSKGGVAAGLKLQTYDLVKRGLDDMIANEISRSAPGTTSATARSLMTLRGRLVDELDRLDVTGITGPNSTRPDGGAYARARAVYSSQPDVLGNRELMGELANIDQLSPEQVVRQLYSGTTGTAQRTAQALGPQGSKAAAAAKIQDIIGGLKSGSLPPRLDADTVSMLRAYSGPMADDVVDVLRVIDKARAGERFLRGSQTQTNQAIQSGMDTAANTALDLATGNKVGVLRKGVDFALDAMRGNPREQYNMDLLNLFTQPRGIEALNEAVRLQKLAFSQPQSQAIASRGLSSAIGAQQSSLAGQQSLQAPISATLSSSGSLPSGFVLEENNTPTLPRGFILQGGQ